MTGALGSRPAHLYARAMYLGYMDECGNTGTKADPAQPIHFLGCLLVEDRRIRDLEAAIAEVARRHFPNAVKRPRFEFHGVELFAGSGPFKGKPQTRIDATSDLIRAVVDHGAGF